MLKNYVGEWLFPRMQRSQYNHEFKIIVVSIVSGLLVGGGVAAVMILRGAVRQIEVVQARRGVEIMLAGSRI